MQRRLLPLLLSLACALMLTAPAPAAPPTPSPFIPFWIGKSARVSDAELNSLLRQVSRRDASPQHIVVLMHGWNDTRQQSAQIYDRVCPLVEKHFQAMGQRVVIVGLQWKSAVGGENTWVPQYVLHQAASVVGLGKAVPDPYGDRVALARRIGFYGARQMVLALNERFPDATVHLLSNSMSCVTAWYAIRPEAPYIHDRAPRYRPEQPLKLGVVCMAGADLDADVFTKDPTLPLDSLPRVLWITIPGFANSADTDLEYHHVTRFKTAMGDEGPRLTMGQMNTLFGAGRIIYDSRDVPKNHTFADYFGDRLIGNVAAAAADLRGATHHSLDLTQVQDVLAAPASAAALQPMLDRGRLQARITALWRLETLQEGSAKHLQDGSLYHLARAMYKNPRSVQKHVASNPCLLVRDGAFPTPSAWAAAFARTHQPQAVGAP